MKGENVSEYTKDRVGEVRVSERERQKDKRQRCVMKNSIGFAFFFVLLLLPLVSCCVTFALDLCESFLDHKNKLRSGIFVSYVKSFLFSISGDDF
jgi:hypothetical protein